MQYGFQQPDLQGHFFEGDLASFLANCVQSLEGQGPLFTNDTIASQFMTEEYLEWPIFGLLYTLTNYDELSLLQPSASIEEVDA